jgi:hypothetical protein
MRLIAQRMRTSSRQERRREHVDRSRARGRAWLANQHDGLYVRGTEDVLEVEAPVIKVEPSAPAIMFTLPTK